MLSAILYLAAPVVVCLIKSMIRIMTIGDDVGEGIGDGVGDDVGDNVGDNNVGDDIGDDVGDNNVGDDVGDNVGDGVGLRRIAPLGFRKYVLHMLTGSLHSYLIHCVYRTGTGTQDLVLGVPATILYSYRSQPPKGAGIYSYTNSHY